MPGKALVVDANILIRGVLGKRVRHVIETHCEAVSFSSFLNLHTLKPKNIWPHW